MANLPWQDNFLACYPAVLEQLRRVKQVKKVLEAQDFANISSERKQRPLDGAVYVIFDGFTPTQPNNTNREQILDIGFSVILAKTNITPRPQTNGIGETLTAIAKALQGFLPVDQQGNDLTITPFEQKPALSIQYLDGFAYFPLRFTAQVAILNDL